MKKLFGNLPFRLLLGVVLGVIVALIRVTWDKNGAEMYGASKGILHFANTLQYYGSDAGNEPRTASCEKHWK